MFCKGSFLRRTSLGDLWGTVGTLWAIEAQITEGCREALSCLFVDGYMGANGTLQTVRCSVVFWSFVVGGGGFGEAYVWVGILVWSCIGVGALGGLWVAELQRIEL